MNTLKVRYAFEKTTKNFHVYGELKPDGTAQDVNLPKERYALNCSRTQYLPIQEITLLSATVPSYLEFTITPVSGPK